MEKIFVHIGSAKTGTTSIQNTFAANRKQLENQGFIYPGDEVKHHKLFFTTRSASGDWPTVFNGVDKKILRKDIDNYFVGLEKDLNKKYPFGILSSEYLFINNHNYINNIHQYLSNFSNDIAVCLFVREPAEFYRSYEAQKLHARGYVTSPYKFKYAFRDVIEAWSNFCEVEVFEYNSRFNAFDILSERIGIDTAEFSSSNNRSNQTESIEQLALLEKIQNNVYPKQDNFYKNHLSIIWNSKSLFNNQPTLKQKVRDIINHRHAEDLNWLRMNHRIDFNITDQPVNTK